MPATLEDLTKSLAECGLMTAEEIQSFLDGLPDDQRPQGGDDLLKLLYRDKKLTKFQAQAVYQGKTRGLVVGNYVVLDRLGSGGMGQVYLAEHRRMERVVALKVLPSAATKSSDAVQRFQREVRAAAKLFHPNVVTAHDADEAEGIHFLVMEYVEGSDLSSLVKGQGPLPVSAAVDYVLQAARGLEYAHGAGVIHRDIKPSNLLLDKKGTIKVLDMGLARIEGTVGATAAEEGLTQSGQLMGTLDYMAPEQAMDTRSADGRADVYSLGCTLFYLLSGRAIYAGENFAQKLYAHREESIPSLRAVRGDVPEALDSVFQRMVAKRPEDRQQSMGEVMAQLRGCVSAIGAAGKPVPPLPAANGYAETVGMDAESLAATEIHPRLPLGMGDLDFDHSVQLPPLPSAALRGRRRRLRAKTAILLGGVALSALLILLLIATILRNDYRPHDGPATSQSAAATWGGRDAEVTTDDGGVNRDPPSSTPVDEGPGEPPPSLQKEEQPGSSDDFSGASETEESPSPGSGAEERPERPAPTPSLPQRRTFPRETASSPDASTAVPQRAASSGPTEEGFVDLIGSRLSQHWQGSSEHFSIENGTLISRFGQERSRAGTAHLYSRRQYGDFVLRFDFRVSPRAASGVLIRSPKPVNAWWNSIEIEIADDSVLGAGAKGWRIPCGSIFDSVKAPRGHLKPPGLWNRMEILAQGAKVRITLNGAVVVDVDVNRASKAHPKHAGLKTRSGYVGLCGPFSQGTVEYRNVRIQEL